MYQMDLQSMSSAKSQDDTYFAVLQMLQQEAENERDQVQQEQLGIHPCLIYRSY